MALEDLEKHYKGGTGSGDFGHTGRPGKIGGSGGGGGNFVRPTTEYMEDNNSPDCKKYPKGCDSLWEYTDEAWEGINGALRGGDKAWNWEKAEANRHVPNMDRIMDAAPGLSKNIVVTRGTTGDHFSNLQPGDTFNDKGYVSTTILSDLKVAGFGAKATQFNINIPKGTKGMYLGKNSSHSAEKEYLLPRNSSFIIDSRRELPNGKVVYDATLTGTIFN